MNSMKADMAGVRNDIWPDDGIILYDGVCVLCSGWMRFVVARDPARRFRFTPIQSTYGQALATALGIDPADPDTNAVLLDGRVYRRSDAALAVLQTLPHWKWVRQLRWLPRRLRDPLYNVLARKRYALFGKYDRCDVGDASFAGRIVTAMAPEQGRRTRCNEA
jgi:predicted DCC family thiol-disulfide oxidoreductase YuxK